MYAAIDSSDTVTPTTRAQTLRRLMAGVAMAALAVFVPLAVGPGESASAATAVQCNSVDNTPGLGMECDVTIVNNLDLATGVTSSTTTIRECHGAANTAPASCTGPTTTSSTELVSSVSQCNSAVNGGGASLRCTIHVVNNITGVASATAATVNQCNGSLGGGLIVLRACSPDGSSTTNATITQCNDSDNGGTSSLTCVVEPGSTTSGALPVTVDQCNGSANGGGSLVECIVGMTTNVLAAVVPELPPVVPEVTPGVPGTPGTPGTPGVVPPAGSGDLVPSPGSPTDLPETGDESMLLILPAAAAVLLGAMLILRARREAKTSG